MSKSSHKYISVFIPTFNGQDFLAESLEAILHQELPEGYQLELLIIDSGSSDNTLQILEAYKQRLTLIAIPNSEFSHGGTRSKAAHIAKGEFMLFLSQDATPASYRWLINMIEPFFISPRVGCVFGRQIPRPQAPPTIKREVAGVFGNIGAPDSIIIHRYKSLVDQTQTNALNSFFSDVNSAVRRDLLVGEVPFRNVHYAEDQSLAEDMQDKGYLKAYTPLGAVWHSNDYTAYEYFKRKFDEYTGLQESLDQALPASKKSLLGGWIRPTIADYRFIRRDSDYLFRSKVKWLVLAPVYNVANKAGKYYAAKHLNNQAARDKLSLEAKARRKDS